jgi:hypothetical protein
MSQLPTEQDRLFHLERLVPLCETIRKGTEYATALAQATSEVKNADSLPDRLRSLQLTVKLLVGTSHLPVAELDAELAAITKAGRAIEKCVEAESLRDARFSVKEAQQSLQRAEAIVAKAWTAVVSADFSSLQRLGEVLAGIVDTKAAGRELHVWAERVLALRGSGPPTPESLKQFAAAKAELADHLAILGKLGIDASVADFLVNVAGKGATLENLTPGVLAWLHAKNAGSRFRIELP